MCHRTDLIQEEKQKRKLIDAEGKHAQANTALQKAKADLENRINEHNRLKALRDNKTQELEATRQAKAEHDRARQAQLQTTTVA